MRFQAQLQLLLTELPRRAKLLLLTETESTQSPCKILHYFYSSPVKLNHLLEPEQMRWTGDMKAIRRCCIPNAGPVGPVGPPKWPGAGSLNFWPFRYHAPFRGTGDAAGNAECRVEDVSWRFVWICLVLSSRSYGVSLCWDECLNAKMGSSIYGST